jgi:hypothetical protein
VEPVPDDELLAARLRELFRRDGTPPAPVTAAAKDLFGLRDLESELAALVADSAVDTALVAVRGEGPRLLAFEAAGGDAVEVELDEGRLVGQLHPPAAAVVEVQQAGAGHRRVDADPLGRFAVDGLGAGAFRLICRLAGGRTIATTWTL